MADQNTVLKLELTVDEVNVILEALGARPFSQVYGIIHKIHEQANTQLGQNPGMQFTPASPDQ